MKVWECGRPGCGRVLAAGDMVSRSTKGRWFVVLKCPMCFAVSTFTKHGRRSVVDAHGSRLA